MNYFDILLAKKLENDKDVSIVQLNVSENGTYSESGKAYSPVVVDVQPPPNSYLKTPIDSYPATAQQLPIPKCDVTITNQKSCQVLVSDKPFVNDKIPYLFRKSAGGNGVVEKIIGGTIVTNQMIENGDFSDGLNGWTILDEGASAITASNNEATITGNTTYNDGVVIELQTTPGHIYYVTASIKSTGNVRFYDGQNIFTDNITSSSDYKRHEHIISVGTLTSQFFILSKQSINTVNIKNVMCIDITRVIGNGAQYIYGLEQSTAGAGVAYFRQMFPNDYYAYDSGSLQSVNVASKKVVGFNQWDEEWEVGGINLNTGEKVAGTTQIRSKNPIKILSDKDYYLNFWYNLGSQGVNLCFYDSDNVFISGKVKWSSNLASSEIPSNARYLMFGARATRTTYENDICINISDPAKNGTYAPYEEHTYAFDSDLTLRGIPKLDASNNLYYDGDVYENDGTVTRKYGVVDLGSLTWVYEPSGTSGINFGIMRATRASLQNPKLLGDLLCTRYVGINTSPSYLRNNQMIISGTTDYPFLRVRDDAYTDAATFKTAMSGVYLVYELDTPTTESADAYINPQIVDADGTEEFVDYAQSQGTRDVAVPVGHESLYYNGQLYQTDFEQATTGTIKMAELHSIVPPRGEFYMTANGTLSVDVWKK